MQFDHHHDQVLLEKLRAGDTKAFEAIFKKYWRELYVVAKSKLLSHDDAEEIIQSTFSNLWEKRGTLIIHDLSNYLRASVRNRILNHIRDNITKEQYWLRYKSFLPDYSDTVPGVDMEELDHVLQDAINSLPEKSRKIFQLSRVDGKSNKEIANILSLSEKAIEYHLTKSLKNLKVLLRDYIL